MVEIHWTNEAELWLKDIHDYIAQDKKQLLKKLSQKFIKKFKYSNHIPKSVTSMKMMSIKR